MDNRMRALPFLLEGLVEQKCEGSEIRVSLLRSEERSVNQTQSVTAAARAFLASYVSPAVLETFPEWQGILIEFPALGEAVWVVHEPQYGHQLANETGKPAILLDAILARQGQSLEETREALTPFLIMPC
jgi:hypothetical protein